MSMGRIEREKVVKKNKDRDQNVEKVLARK